MLVTLGGWKKKGFNFTRHLGVLVEEDCGPDEGGGEGVLGGEHEGEDLPGQTTQGW